MEVERISENVRDWREKLRRAAVDWGEVQLCAVTKTVPEPLIRAAIDAGVTIVGENRVQEALEKRDALKTAREVHLIGRLQTNKVLKLVGFADVIQSLDRDALALEISKRCRAAGAVMRALIEVNIAGEAQKGGVPETELDAFLLRCARLPGIKIEGLMTVAPQTDDPETARPYFRRMRAHFDRLAKLEIENVEMKCLSMGMSGDCLVAAQEGATMVRLGRALFGARA